MIMDRPIEELEHEEIYLKDSIKSAKGWRELIKDGEIHYHDPKKALLETLKAYGYELIDGKLVKIENNG